MTRKKVVGIFSHVDAGKTTLTEALLYQSGRISSLGNVNKGTTFFDNHPLERQRGITFLSKPMTLTYQQEELTFIDTPGHMDLTFEMERSLQVVDVAVVLVSSTEGITGYTETILSLCQEYQVPVLLFINKCDLPNSQAEQVLHDLEKSDERFIEVDQIPLSENFKELWELLDEESFEQSVSDEKWAFSQAFLQRKLFPVVKGSAAQIEKVDWLLELLTWLQLPESNQGNVGQVYKIADYRGQRYHLVKVLSGHFQTKDKIKLLRQPEEELKINQLLALHGEKVEALERANAGEIVGIMGMPEAKIGDLIGASTLAVEDFPKVKKLVRQPALEVQVLAELDPETLLSHLRLLEEEDPSLNVRYETETREIFIQVVGPIQMDYLQESFELRFNEAVTFSKPSVLYKETLLSSVRGNGHYEPLRHYAEVALWMEPGDPGSGIQLANQCTLEQLSINYQKGILHHLSEKVHRGVLLGAPLTDVKITLLAGIAHNPETKGGDFREATYRAVRQGLMKAKSQVLEPWYAVKMTVPIDLVGKVVTDIQKYQGKLEPIEQTTEEMAVVEATVPVATFIDYPVEFASFTKNKGRLTTTVKGYYPCHNEEDVLANQSYNPESDFHNTPNSIFFAKGKGYDVSWRDVDQTCHIQLKELPK